MKVLNLIILSHMFSGIVQAAGKGSGSVKDLIFPAINFTVLFGFIIYKYKNVLSRGYSEESLRVENLISDAAEADKQATLKLETLTNQYKNIDNLKKDLKEKANQKLHEQVELINAEAKQNLKKLEQDKESRFEQDKTILLNTANSSILDLVISDAKQIVTNDKDTKRIAEEKLLGSIQ